MKRAVYIAIGIRLDGTKEVMEAMRALGIGSESSTISRPEVFRTYSSAVSMDCQDSAMP